MPDHGAGETSLGFYPSYRYQNRATETHTQKFSQGYRSKKQTSDEFDTFLNNAIQLFKYQRTKGHQFAFLVVTKDNDVAKVQFHTREKVVSSWSEATDSKFPSYPPNYLLGNYICARPDKSDPKNAVHTEIILLGRLESLMMRRHGCRTILLYTWLFPCRRCAAEIIASLGSRGKYGKHRRVLVYTSAVNYKKYGAQLRWDIEKLLASAGIEVFQTKGRIPL